MSEPQPRRRNPWWIPPFLGRVPEGIEDRHLAVLGVVALALLFESYDMSLLTAALGKIGRDFDMNEAEYREEERRLMDEAGGYWAHAGGLSPILKAGSWIRPDTVSTDLGAGN